MNALGVALDVRTLIVRGWTQPTGPTKAEECFARFEDGSICSPLNAAASRFTLSGAMMRVAQDDRGDRQFMDRHPEMRAFYETLKRHVPKDLNPVKWSNEPGRWKRDVVAALDATIAQLRAENPDA